MTDAGTAKTVAEAALARAEAARTSRTVSLGLAGLAVSPGDCVTIAGETGSWRVVDAAMEGYAVTLTMSPIAPATLSATATSGRSVGAPDQAIGTTLLEAAELPGLDDQPLAAPRLTIAATGTGEGWRRAALLLSTDDGASWTPIGATAAPATIGTLASVPPAVPSTLFDEATVLIVTLARPDMVLADADDALLDGGANLALAGEELIQFGRAEPLGDARWRLSRLLRGRRGTEAASGTQAPGDRFVLLEADTARSVDLSLASLGTRVRVMASGVGDTAGPVEAALVVSGRSVVPPSPVHLAAATGEDGSRSISWVRRSRAGWRWIDGVDVPLGEEAESYRVTLNDDGGTRAVAAAAPSAAVTSSDRLGGPLTIGVTQSGTFGPSLPATITIA